MAFLMVKYKILTAIIKPNPSGEIKLSIEWVQFYKPGDSGKKKKHTYNGPGQKNLNALLEIGTQKPGLVMKQCRQWIVMQA